MKLQDQQKLAYPRVHLFCWRSGFSCFFFSCGRKSLLLLWKMTPHLHATLSYSDYGQFHGTTSQSISLPIIVEVYTAETLVLRALQFFVHFINDAKLTSSYKSRIVVRYLNSYCFSGELNNRKCETTFLNIY